MPLSLSPATQFVLDRPFDAPAAGVAKEAKRAGHKLTPKQVHAVRTRWRRKHGAESPIAREAAAAMKAVRASVDKANAKRVARSKVLEPCARCAALAPQLCGEHIRLDARRRAPAAAKVARTKLVEQMEKFQTTHAAELGAATEAYHESMRKGVAALSGNGSNGNGHAHELDNSPTVRDLARAAFPWKLAISTAGAAFEATGDEGDAAPDHERLEAFFRWLVTAIGTLHARALLAEIESGS